MKRLILAVLIFAGLAFAQTTPVCPGPNGGGSAVLNPAVTATTVVIAANGHTIRLCKVTFNVVQGSSPVNFSLIAGTGAACGTNTVQLTQVFTGVASVTQTYDYAVDISIGWFAGTNVSVCLSLSGAPTSATVHVQYGNY